MITPEDLRAKLQGIIGAAIGFSCVIFVEFLLVMLLSEIFHSRVTPRGLGWIVIPVIAGVAGWKIGTSIDIKEYFLNKGIRFNCFLKIWIAGTSMWIFSVAAFYFTFNPYGSYWSKDDKWQCLLVFVMPPILGIIGIVFYRWAIYKEKISK
jgi:hypothetical protein